MPCSPTYLNVDRSLWDNPNIFYILSTSYKNYTQGEKYDCGLKSVPCESNITRLFVFPDTYHDLIFWFDIFVSYFATSVFVLLGIFGNIGNIIIFSKTKIANESTNTLLLAVAVADLLHASAHGCLICVMLLCFIDVSAAISAFNLVFPALYYMSVWFGVLGYDLVAVLAIQRAAVVLMPFRAPIICSNRNTKIVVGVLVALCGITMCPLLVQKNSRWVFHPYFNKFIALGNTYRFDFKLAMLYRFSYISSRVIVDIVLVLGSVIITIIKLKAQSKSRADLTKPGSSGGTSKSDSDKPQMSTRELNAMKMSLSVCSITASFGLLVSAISWINALIVGRSFKTPVASLTMYFTKCVTAAYCAFNFFLYLALSPQYKEKCKQMFWLSK